MPSQIRFLSLLLAVVTLGGALGLGPRHTAARPSHFPPRPSRPAIKSSLAVVNTITVTSAADAGGTCPGADCTLRQAIAAALPGDTIDFAVTGTIRLTSGELLVDKNLTIAGRQRHHLRPDGGERRSDRRAAGRPRRRHPQRRQPHAQRRHALRQRGAA